MMDLTQQPFTLAGSLWSCRWVYKHRLLRSVSDWERLLCVCVREREQCGNTDKWDIYQHPTRQTQIYCARILFKAARFFSMHHFALQVSCLLAHRFGFKHNFLVLCYSQTSQHFFWENSSFQKTN